jgi:hypothetical protein
MEKAGRVSGERKTEQARQNQHNIFFHRFVTNYEKNNGVIYGKNKVEKVVEELNFLGAKTSTGMEFTTARFYSMQKKVRLIYSNN